MRKRKKQNLLKISLTLRKINTFLYYYIDSRFLREFFYFCHMTEHYLLPIFTALIAALLVYLYMRAYFVRKDAYVQLQNETESVKTELSIVRTRLIAAEETSQIAESNLVTANEKIQSLVESLQTTETSLEIFRDKNLTQSNQLDAYERERALYSSGNKNLTEENIKLKAELQAVTTHFTEYREKSETLQQDMKLQFENLASKILEEKQEKFTELNKRNLFEILKPLGENIEQFKKKVDEVYQNEARERHSLDKTIQLMMKQTEMVSKEANNLASALKGQTKIQGDWGEMILERILENSGLTEGREFYKQQSLRNEENTVQRPDFILRLPGNQLVMIDSKVSLNAYERMTASEDPETQKKFLQLHLASLKKHVDTLALKKYDAHTDALDFTIMFVPVEPAFLLGMQHESQLWNYAYKKQVIILSPTNLIAYLKLISDVWRRDEYNKNAAEIAERGGKLLDKFVLFVESLTSVGKKLDEAKDVYQKAYKQLYSGRDNLVSQTQKLKALGAKGNKELKPEMKELADNESTTHKPLES